ncbi:MAG: DUF6015 family protein [Methanomassiliicoccales archaeon]
MDAASGPMDVERLAKAITAATAMENSEAVELAEIVLAYFGFGDRVIDNTLDQEDRKVFYLLYDAGILTSEWEETLLANGRIWRIFYWTFDRDNIDRILRKKETVQTSNNIYEELPSGAWKRHQNEV